MARRRNPKGRRCITIKEDEDELADEKKLRGGGDRAVFVRNYYGCGFRGAKTNKDEDDCRAPVPDSYGISRSGERSKECCDGESECGDDLLERQNGQEGCSEGFSSG